MTCSGSHPAFCPMGTDGKAAGACTTHFHLVPKLRMHGAVPALLVYVSISWYLVKHRDHFTFVTLPLYHCPAHRILLDVTTITILIDLYTSKSRNFSQCDIVNCSFNVSSAQVF